MDRKKVLLVEDEKDMAYAIKMKLEQNQFQVLTAEDGQAALDTARREKPDLILLEVIIPKMHGLKVCRLLKFDDKYKHIPIIIMTVKKQSFDEKLGYEAGADLFLTKPVDPGVLLKEISELLTRK